MVDVEASSGMMPFGVYGWTALAIAVVAAVIKRRRSSKNPAKKGAEQEPWPIIKAQNPGDPGVKILHGVRVVEMATILAAPACGRALSDLGAEVIKVEASRGDPHRKHFPGEKRERHCGSMYETMGAGKACVTIDVKKERSKLIAMLKDADVFLTNIRQHQLEHLGIRYEDLKDELPHLVVAHLTAWGRDGPDAALPGYDVGSYWAATGLAAAIQPEWCYSRYPTAFGDISTGSGGLLGGILIGLTAKLRTGNGSYVENSLFRTGIWVNAPNILSVNSAGSIKPDTRTLDLPISDYSKTPVIRPALASYYQLADGILICLCADKASADAVKLLLKRLEISGEPTHAALEDKLGSKGFEAVKSLLDFCDIPFVRRTTMANLAVNRGEQPDLKASFTNLDCGKDMDKISTVPFDFGNLDTSPRFAAMASGVHTDAFQKAGWSPRNPAASLTQRAAGVLKVIELSEFETASIAGATKLMSEMCDCAVTKYVAADAPAVPADRTRFWDHIDRQKTKVTYISLAQVAAAVGAEAGQSDQITVFATNFPPSVLKKAGLDHATLTAKYPKLVVVVVTGLGLDGDERCRGELAAWYCNSSVSSMMGTPGTVPPMLPYQLGELVTALYAFAAANAAVFRVIRTGSGMATHVARNRVAVWSNVGVLPLFLTGDAELLESGISGVDGFDWWERAFPAFQCFRTKDGAWVMGLMHPIDQLFKWLKVFQARPEAAVRAIFTALASKATRKSTTLGHVAAGFTRFSFIFQRNIERMTLAEWKAFADNNDLWWAPICDAENVLRNVQARENGAISEAGGVVTINCPVQRK